MPTPSLTSRPNNEVLLERVENLRCDTGEIKEAVKELSGKVENLLLNYGLNHEKVVNRTEDAHRRIDDLEKIVKSQGEQLLKLSKSIEPLVTSNKILVWIAGGFGLLLIGFLFMILTHQVTVTFP